MKRIFAACLFGLALGTGTALANGELHIFNWGDYTNPDLIKKFEQKYNVKVTVTDYDSNDTALAKIRAGGHGFDELEFDRYTEFHLLTRELTEMTSDIATISTRVAGTIREFAGDLTRLGRLTRGRRHRHLAYHRARVRGRGIRKLDESRPDLHDVPRPPVEDDDTA